MFKYFKNIILRTLITMARSKYLSNKDSIINLNIFKKLKDPNNFVYCWNIFNNNIYMRVNKSSYIDKQILYNKKYSKNINFHIFEKYRPDTIYIDVGANVGSTALPVAVKERNLEVHAFEPNPKIFEILNVNKLQNNCDNLFLHNYAVGLKEEKLQLFITQKEKANFGTSSLQNNNDIIDSKSIQVDVIKLDDFFEKKKKMISLLKIDVQGFEWQVIQGAKNIIIKEKPTIIFEHDDQYLSEPTKVKKELEKFFEEHRYNVFEIDVYDFRKLKMIDWKKNIKANLIALKN